MSRKLRLGTYKLGGLIADMRETHLKAYTQETVTDSMIMKAYNDALMSYYDLSGIKDQDVYVDKVPLPIVKKVFSNGAAGGSLDATAQILTLPLEDADILWTDSNGFDADWEGTQIVITDTGDGLDYHVEIVDFLENIGGFTQVSVEPTPTGKPFVDIAAADLLVQGETSAYKTADEIDLTRYVNYKRIDKIIKMTKSDPSGRSTSKRLCLEMKSSKEFQGLRESHQTEYSNYKNDIIWWRSGEILERSKGHSVSSYGNCLLELTLFPAVMAENEDYLDAPDTEKPNVDKIALVKVFSFIPADERKTQLPQDVMNYYQELMGSKAAKEEEKSK